MKFNQEDLQNFIDDIVDVKEVQTGYATIIYGRNGTGKTRTASTWPKPLLLADIGEIGTASIKNVKGVKVKRIRKHEDIEMLYWFMKTQNSKLKTPFKSLVIDTVTQWENLVLKFVMDKEAKEFNMDFEAKDDMRIPLINDYGKAASLLKSWIMRFRDLIEDNIYVVFNVQEKSNNNEDVDSDDYQVFPQMMKSIRGIAGGAVSFIIHTEIKEITKTVGNEIKSIPVYIARTGPSSKYLTKVRVPVGTYLPPYIVNPSYEQLTQLADGVHPSQIKKSKKENKEE